MSTNRIKLESCLSAAETGDVDAFCAGNPGIAALPALARFLKNQFGLALELDPDIVAGFVTDSSNLPGAAQGVCRPASLKDSAAIFRACFKAKIPVTVSGGKSNLTGSATPENGIIVSTVLLAANAAPDVAAISPDPDGLPRLRIDPERLQVECPAGIILEELRKAVQMQSGGKLVFPVNPTSRAEASVGGALACNASGFVPGAVGATRHWVEAVHFLLPDGRCIRACRGQYLSQDGQFLLEDGRETTALPVPRYPRPAIKNAGGPYSAPDGVMDFIDLVVGSEGIFGMVIACTLRLAPSPAAVLELFFSLPAEDDAVAFYQYLHRRLHGELSQLEALEYFGVNCPQYMKHRDLLFRPGHEVGIYLAVPLQNQTLDEAAEAWLSVLLEADCRIPEDAVMILDNNRTRTLFFEARHSLPANAIEVAKSRGSFTIMTDTVVPPDRFQEFLTQTHRLLHAAGVDYVAFGHLGDCHLHFTLMPHQAQIDCATELYDQIIALSADLGGVYSGEHGTGKRKRRDFLRCYGPAAIADVRRCKAAVDPDFLFNRGNVVEAGAPCDSRHACAMI